MLQYSLSSSIFPVPIPSFPFDCQGVDFQMWLMHQKRTDHSQVKLVRITAATCGPTGWALFGSPWKKLSPELGSVWAAMRISVHGRRRELGPSPCVTALSLCKGEGEGGRRVPLCLALHIPSFLAFKKSRGKKKQQQISVNIIVAFFGHSSPYFPSLALALSNMHLSIPKCLSSPALHLL